MTLTTLLATGAGAFLGLLVLRIAVVTLMPDTRVATWFETGVDAFDSWDGGWDDGETDRD